jgi:hypothetical protein
MCQWTPAARGLQARSRESGALSVVWQHISSCQELLSQGRDPHPAGPDPGVAPADALLGRAVDLDVGGIQVDGRIAQNQPGSHRRRGRASANPAWVDAG